MARALRPQGVGVTVLCPELVSTNLGETARFSGVPAERRAAWLYFPEEMRSAVDPDAVGVLAARHREVADGRDRGFAEAAAVRLNCGAPAPATGPEPRHAAVVGDAEISASLAAV